MSAGYTLDKTGWDGVMGAAVWQLILALNEVTRINTKLNDANLLPDATLTALGYSAGDITQIRAAFTALANLNSIAHGQLAQPSANDFFWDAKHLTGVQG